MANAGNLNASLVGTLQESVLLTLRRLFPSVVTSYESVLKVMTSKRNKLNRVNSLLVAGEVSAVFSMLTSLSRENQLLRTAQLEKSQTVTPGLIKRLGLCPGIFPQICGNNQASNFVPLIPPPQSRTQN